jgi:carboxypeptidase Taq
MTSDLATNLAELRAVSSELVHLGRIGQVLGWDQETYMPPGGTPHRAAQVATLEGISHERLTSPRVGELLGRVAEAIDTGIEVSTFDRALVRELRRDYDRAIKLPPTLVRALAQATSEGVEQWRRARAESNWSLFAGNLRQIVDLKRQEAQHVGYAETAYDALLDTYEPGMTVAVLTPLLTDLRRDTVALLDQINQSSTTLDAGVVEQEYPSDRQVDLGKQVLAAFGFDLTRGRLDTSTHPFATGIGPGDVRLTTRGTSEMLHLLSTIHEAGHGLYEQGLDPELADSIVGQSCSLGIHESQSRLWENFIARSLPFWRYFFPQLATAFPDQVAGHGPEDIVRALNRVEPTLIRTEADEVTYNLHIIVRFEIERRLIADEISVDDLPDIFNQMMREYLGLTPPNDREGVLQDIHWSFGLFGYFPTYTLGNLYAAQLWNAIRRDLPDLDNQLAAGEFTNVLGWTRERIHRHGRVYRPTELVERATGEPINPRYLVNYLNDKYGQLYGFASPSA